MKEFLAYLLITAGLLAMGYALVFGIAGQGDPAVAGGFGLLAVVIGAAIKEPA